MAQTDFALLCNGAGNRERFQPYADFFSRFYGGFHAGFQADGAAECVSPDRIVERNGLNALHDLFDIYPFGKAEAAGVFQAAKAVLGKALLDFGHSSFFTFKRDIVSHFACPP